MVLPRKRVAESVALLISVALSCWRKSTAALYCSSTLISVRAICALQSRLAVTSHLLFSNLSCDVTSEGRYDASHCSCMPPQCSPLLGPHTLLILHHSLYPMHATESHPSPRNTHQHAVPSSIHHSLQRCCNPRGAWCKLGEDKLCQWVVYRLWQDHLPRKGKPEADGAL